MNPGAWIVIAVTLIAAVNQLRKAAARVAERTAAARPDAAQTRGAAPSGVAPGIAPYAVVPLGAAPRGPSPAELQLLEIRQTLQQRSRSALPRGPAGATTPATGAAAGPVSVPPAPRPTGLPPSPALRPAVPSGAPAGSGWTLAAAFGDSAHARTAVILAEVLGPPRALR